MGMGQNITAFTPYMFPTFGFGGTLSSSLSDETSAESVQRRKKEEEKKAMEDSYKRMQELNQSIEAGKKLKEQLAELDKSRKDIDSIINKAANGTEAADGSIQVKDTWDDYQKLPLWKKCIRAGGNLAQGAWKLAEGFVGYKVNEKTGEKEWSPTTAIKNAAIAAGCLALTAIPGVGPVISTAFLATGAICGSVGTIRGINKALKAQNPQELDNAFQDIGSGFTIGASSILGLRGLGKGLQASATSSAATATGTTASASAGTAATISRSTSKNTILQFVKDVTLNSYRATVKGIQSDKTSIAADGFWKTYGANIKGIVPKLGKTKFETTKSETVQNINTRLGKIKSELKKPGISAESKALLKQEQKLLNEQIQQLNNVKTKLGWKNLKTNSKAHEGVSKLENAVKELEINGATTITGRNYTKSEQNLKALREVLNRTKDLSKQVEKLSKVRSSTIKKMSFYKKYASEVEEYTGTTRNYKIGRIYDSYKFAKADITWKKALLAPLKAVWDCLNIPFKVWGYAGKSSSSTFYKLQETILPTYEAGLFDELLGFGKTTLTTKVVQQNEKGESVEQEIAVTREVLTQIEEQKKQLDTTYANLQNELNKSYVA